MWGFGFACYLAGEGDLLSRSSRLSMRDSWGIFIKIIGIIHIRIITCPLKPSN